MTAITSATSLPATTATTYVNPVASSSTYAGLSSTATKLSMESGIVANLGGSSSTTPLYSAVGLLNSIISAGQPTDAASTPATSGAPSSSSGNYTANGSVASTASGVNANWASILQADPAAAGTVAADSTIQGIVSSISTTA